MLSEAEVKEANARRVAGNNYEKAVKQTAVEESIESAALLKFSRNHAPGERAKKNGPYLCVEANDRLLIELAREIGHGIADDFSLDQAYRVLMDEGRLALPPGEDYERKTNTLQSRIAPQIKTFAPPPLKLPFTRAEILAWSTKRLSAEMAKSPAHVQALNDILASR